ncbi:MAG: ATP-grasp domain-containing protein [Gemmatimonadales bacterium]
MADRSDRLVVAGLTTRALARSATRAGWNVTAVDAFGDLDLRACARVIALRRGNQGFDPSAAAEAARAVPADAAAYTSSFENHPSAVAALAAGRRLLGNSRPVLERVRDPLALVRALRRDGFDVPLCRAGPPRAEGTGPRRWLLKPRRSGGGHGTSAWRPGLPVRRHQYLQERIPGTPGSVVFLADGRRALTLALSRQIVGQRVFGARGFRYCGSLMGAGLFGAEPTLFGRAAEMADALTREFGLVGLNGIDFIARAGVPWPIEVNPRYSSSMELLERGSGNSLFTLHLDACMGRLPEAPAPPAPGVVGKAVVFARRDVTTGDTRGWLRDPAIADVPHRGERIPRGRPVCTVFAAAKNADTCLRALATKAAAIYRAVEPAARGAA